MYQVATTKTLDTPYHMHITPHHMHITPHHTTPYKIPPHITKPRPATPRPATPRHPPPAGLNACVESGRLEEAQELLRSLTSNGRRLGHGAYNILIKYHSLRGDIDGARRCYLDMKQACYEPDIFTYNTLLFGYARRGDLVGAEAVMDQARQHGLRLDVWSYAPYIRVCVRHGDVGRVQAALRDMDFEGIQANEFIYGCLLEGHLLNGDLGQAEELMRGMREAAAAGDGRVAPSLVMYNMLIRYLCRQGGVEGPSKAVEQLALLRQQGLRPGIDTYSILLQHAVEPGAGQDGVQALMQQLAPEGLVPDTVMYTSLVKMQSVRGDIEQALGTFAEQCAQPSSTVDLMALNNLVAVFARRGRMKVGVCHAGAA